MWEDGLFLISHNQLQMLKETKGTPHSHLSYPEISFLRTHRLIWMYKNQSNAAPNNIISLPLLASIQSHYVMYWFLDDLWACRRKQYSSETLKVVVAILISFSFFSFFFFFFF